MAARNEIPLIITARDRTRAVFGRIRGALGRLGTRIAGLFAVGALAKMATDGMRFASAMRRGAEALGITTTELQAATDHMRQFGVDADDVNDALFSIGQARSEAMARGGEAMQDAFAELGITMATLQRTRNPLELFLHVAAAAENLGDNVADYQHAFSRLLGEDNARRFMGVLRRGPDEFVTGMEQALQSGRVLDTQSLNQAAETYKQAADAAVLAQVKLADVTGESVAAMRELGQIIRDEGIIGRSDVQERAQYAVWAAEDASA